MSRKNDGWKTIFLLKWSAFQVTSVLFLKGGLYCDSYNSYIPRTQLTPIFEGQPSKKKAQTPFKTAGSFGFQVLYFGIYHIQVLSPSHLFFWEPMTTSTNFWLSTGSYHGTLRRVFFGCLGASLNYHPWKKVWKVHKLDKDLMDIYIYLYV